MNNDRIRLILSIISAIFVANCSLEEPVMPEWDLPIKVPFSGEKFLFSEELADSSSGIEVRGDTLAININGEMETRSVRGEDLIFAGSGSADSFPVGIMELDSIRTESADSVFLSDIMPSLSSNIGNYVSIPETTMTGVPLEMESDDFSSVVISRCQLEIEVYNRFPFTIGPNIYSPEGMSFSVHDSTGSLITDLNISEEIPPGGKAVALETITPGENWIRAPLTLEYDIPVARDTVILLTDDIYNNASCVFRVTLLDLSVTEIIGKVPAQQITESHFVGVEGADRIIRGLISSGGIDLFCSSSIPVGAGFSVSIPDFRSPGGLPFSGNLRLSPGGSGSFSENLSGYTIENHLNEGSPIDSFSVVVRIVTDDSDGFVHLSSTDEIDAQFLIKDLQMTDVEGYLSPDTIGVERFQEHDVVDYGGFSGGVEFEYGYLILKIDNEMNVENMYLNLDLTGYHTGDDGVITDSSKVALEGFEISSAGETVINLSGPQVVDLLNIYPTDIACSGELIYGGYADISVGDAIDFRYSLSTPFEVTIRSAEPVDFDTDTLSADDLGEDFRDAAGDDIRSARITALITNRSPVGGEALLFISADPGRGEMCDTTGYSGNPDEFYKTIEMGPAPVDPSTGFAEEAAVSEVEFMLSTEELRVFRNSVVRSGLRLYLNDTGGPVILRGSDYIEFAGQIEMKIRVKKD
ncbi:MAG: hypothetical protein ACQERI_11015 [Candidatus Krumholzibacteriota bacterium]